MLRAEAEQALAAADDLEASDAYRLILEIAPYDQGCHRGLIESLRSLGAFGQAEAGVRRYEAAMAEIGISVDIDFRRWEPWHRGRVGRRRVTGNLHVSGGWSAEVSELIESRDGHEPFRCECRNVG